MNTNMRKRIALLLALVFVVSAVLTGCGQPAGEEAPPPTESGGVGSGTIADDTGSSPNPPYDDTQPEDILPPENTDPDIGAEDDSVEPTPVAPEPTTPAPGPTPTPEPTPTPTPETTPTPTPELTPVPAPTPDPTPAPMPTPEPENASTSTTLSGDTLEVRFGDEGAAFILNLYDNDTAAAIARHVGTADWRLPIYHYDDYTNWEIMQYYDIPSRYDIPSNPESVTSVKAGEVYYSEPNRIILFYGDGEVSSEYTPVGYIDNTQAFVDAVENNPVVPGWSNKLIHISIAD